MKPWRRWDTGGEVTVGEEVEVPEDRSYFVTCDDCGGVAFGNRDQLRPATERDIRGAPPDVRAALIEAMRLRAAS